MCVHKYFKYTHKQTAVFSRSGIFQQFVKPKILGCATCCLHAVEEEEEEAKKKGTANFFTYFGGPDPPAVQ